MTFTCAPVLNVMGANSKLGNDQHILMWDFDNKSLMAVKASLSEVQKRELLPEIRIFQTSKGNKYQAWCYDRVSWWDCKRIIASTHYVDEGFYRFGVFRGHFTLRTSSKHGFTPHLVAKLDIGVVPHATEFDLISWTRYETLA